MRLNLEGFTEQEVLQFVLDGLERRRDEILARIQALRDEMATGKPKTTFVGARRPALPPPKPVRPSRPPLSQEARDRIAAAQHKRWKKVHAAEKAARRPAPPPKRAPRGRPKKAAPPPGITGSIAMSVPAAPEMQGE